MVGKNNKKLLMEMGANKFKRYTLKKLSIGVASVSIGIGLMFGATEQVSAQAEAGTVIEHDEPVNQDITPQSEQQEPEIDHVLEAKRQEVNAYLVNSNLQHNRDQFKAQIDQATSVSELVNIENQINVAIAEQVEETEKNNQQSEEEQEQNPQDAQVSAEKQSEELEKKRKAVKNELGKSEIVIWDDYLALLNKINEATSIEELDAISAKIRGDKASEKQDEKEQEADNTIEQTAPATPQQPQVDVQQNTSKPEVEYTLDQVRHFFNQEEIAKIEAGQMTIKQALQKALGTQPDIKTNQNHHEENVLAAGVENLDNKQEEQNSTLKRTRRNVDTLFAPFTEANTIRDVYKRIRSMFNSGLIPQTEYDLFRFEMLRHIGDRRTKKDIAGNLNYPQWIEEGDRRANSILNSKLSNSQKVTVLGGENRTELEYVNELFSKIEKMFNTRLRNNRIDFTPPSNRNSARGHHFYTPRLTFNQDGTVTLTAKTEKYGDNAKARHVGLGVNVSDELRDRVVNHGDAEKAAKGFYSSQWGLTSNQGFSKEFSLTFKANENKIGQSTITSSIFLNSFDFNAPAGTYAETKQWAKTAERLTNNLNAVTELNKLQKKINDIQSQIDNLNNEIEPLKKPGVIVSQNKYDELKLKHDRIKNEINNINTPYSNLTSKSGYNDINLSIQRTFEGSKNKIDSSLKNLPVVNDRNDNGIIDETDVKNAENKVNEIKRKHSELQEKIKTAETQKPITNHHELINLYESLKASIQEANDTRTENSISQIPASDDVYRDGQSFNQKRQELTNSLPNNLSNLNLPVAPPTQKVELSNLDGLSGGQKEQVKTNLKANNPELDLSKVTVAADGTVTVQWDEHNSVTVDKSETVELKVNKDALKNAIDKANETTDSEFYGKLEELDPNLKSEYDKAKEQAEITFNNNKASQTDVDDATNKLSELESKISEREQIEVTKKFNQAQAKVKEAQQAAQAAKDAKTAAEADGLITPDEASNVQGLNKVVEA
ncbi:YSIRK-type signal peptide-containing protein, partial [Dolosigranulum pigrum]|uniref:YSIRK-type signal peptide-containing protein n=1 Tax=Dolosigranulum pigrum TaxID=29394 RepID=UPI000DC3AB1F